MKNHKHTINGDWDQTILGNTGINNSYDYKLTIMGNYGTYTVGNTSLKVSGNLEFDIAGKNTYVVGTTLAISSGKLMTIKTGSENIEIDSGKHIHLNKSKTE
jgi:hypothetical protein